MTFDRFWKASAVGVAALLGLALIGADLALSQAWIDRHFLPDFNMSDAGRFTREALARGLMAAAGVGLLLLARRLPHIPIRERMPVILASAGRIAVAICFALGASEVMLRTIFADIFDELRAERRPSRQYDAQLGWAHVPNLTEAITFAGRPLTYAMDAAGNRVRDAGVVIDPAQPTILLAGESVAMGYRLPWEETIAAQVESLAGLQTVNLGVEGYSSAQAYLRLADQAPRFAHPAAVVTIFLPSVFKKVIDPVLPGLSPSLQWRPPAHPWRLAVVAHWLLPYDSDADVTRGVDTARAILRAGADLARAQGAASLIVVPQVMPESPGESLVRKRVLDDAGLAYVLVPLEHQWHVQGDPHPDARGDRALALAIAATLRANGTAPQKEELAQ